MCILYTVSCLRNHLINAHIENCALALAWQDCETTEVKVSQVDERKCKECIPRLHSDALRKPQKEVNEKGENKRSSKMEGAKEEESALCPIFLDVKEKKHEKPGCKNKDQKESKWATCPISLDLDGEGEKHKEPRSEKNNKKKNKNENQKEAGIKNKTINPVDESESAICPLFLDDT